MADISAAAWEAMVQPHFGYLEARYQMQVRDMDDSTWWATSITYGRGAVAVIVRYSVEFSRAEVELVRLVDGGIPPVPIFIHPDTPIDRALLDNLLAIRSPSDSEKLGNLGGIDRESLERSLAFQAKALELHAAGFLNGDTGIFAELDRAIKARLAQNPQRITMSFPEGTSPSEVERGIANAKRIDPRVPIDVKFYKRPRRWPWSR